MTDDVTVADAVSTTGVAMDDMTKAAWHLWAWKSGAITFSSKVYALIEAAFKANDDVTIKRLYQGFSFEVEAYKEWSASSSDDFYKKYDITP